MRTKTWTCVVLLTSVLAIGCADADTDPRRPAGWEHASHDPDVPANYQKLFAEDEVQRIDIVMTADNRQTMLDDMEQLLGALGSSGGLGIPGGGGMAPPELPAEWVAACVGLGSGDSCTIPPSTEGTCTSIPGTDLACLPDNLMMPGGPGFPGGGGGAIDLIGADPAYVPVTVNYDGQRWTQVGMRYKGNSSLVGTWGAGILKLAFRLNFDRYEDEHPETENQRFYGFSEMTFAPAYGDAAMLRDKLASEILLDRGAKAARTTFCRVYVDAGEGPEYWGLYTVIEDPSDALAEAQFGDGSGNMYKPDGTGASFQTFDEESFVKKTNENAADYSDVMEAIAALSAPRDDATAWRGRLEQVFDVDAFLQALAVSRAIGHWDSYGAMAHNYYLYGDPTQQGRLVWISWDHNFTWQGQGSIGGGFASPSVMMDEVGEQWPLIRFLLDDPVYRLRYRAALEDVLHGAYAADAFRARAEQLHALIAPYVVGDEGEVAPYTNLTSPEAFETALSDPEAGLLTQADVLRQAVLDALAADAP